MRFRIKAGKIGEVRTSKVFALFPVVIGDTLVWLERYESTMKYMFVPDPVNEFRWVSKGRRVL